MTQCFSIYLSINSHLHCSHTNLFWFAEDKLCSPVQLSLYQSLHRGTLHCSHSSVEECTVCHSLSSRRVRRLPSSLAFDLCACSHGRSASSSSSSLMTLSVFQPYPPMSSSRHRNRYILLSVKQTRALIKCIPPPRPICGTMLYVSLLIFCGMHYL